MKSSSDENHVIIKNRRPLFTNNTRAEKVDNQHQPRVHLTVQPERKRSRIDGPDSSNINGKNSFQGNQSSGFIDKATNQSMTVTSSEKQNVQQQTAPETVSLRPGFQNEAVNFEGSLNVRRKRSNKRILTITSDYDKANSNRKDILDDESLWLPAFHDNNDSHTNIGMDNHAIDTCTGMSSQDSFTDLFASSTMSTPVSTTQSRIQHESSSSTGNSFSNLFNDDDDLKLAELDVSGIISSYHSASSKVEINKANSNTGSHKLAHAEKHMKIVMNTSDKSLQINNKNTSMSDMHNPSLSKLLEKKDQKITEQVDINTEDVGGNIQNKQDSSNKTIRNIEDEMKNGCQANDVKTSDELFYGLPAKGGHLIKKHKGIEKLYGKFLRFFTCCKGFNQEKLDSWFFYSKFVDISRLAK
jgi:hypothetical protein